MMSYFEWICQLLIFLPSKIIILILVVFGGAEEEQVGWERLSDPFSDIRGLLWISNQERLMYLSNYLNKI